MKQLVLAVALFLAGTTAVTITSCSGEGSADSADSTKKEVKGEQKGESFTASTNIRYVDFDSVMANYEYAKEQGKVLEQTQHQLGIVHNIAAPTRFKIHIKGMADHSGATPMGMRRDALVSAAKLILAVNEAAETEKANGSVGTVGVVDVEPGSINVVPGAVTLWVDVRGVDKASIARVLQSIREQAENVAVCDGVGVQIEMLTADSPVALDKALAAQSEAICTEKGFSFLHMNSGAGHDAMHMTKICPTTMLFVPCRAGISHNPAEYASTENICRGIEVLAEVLRREAN